MPVPLEDFVPESLALFVAWFRPYVILSWLDNDD